MVNSIVPGSEQIQPDKEGASISLYMSEAEVFELISVAQKEYEGYIHLNDPINDLSEDDQLPIASEYGSQIGLVVYTTENNVILETDTF